MNRSVTVTALGVVASAALIFTTACSSDSGASKIQEGPLSAYFTQIDEALSQSANYGAAENDAVENAVAECMTAEGFEYTPEKWVDGEPSDEDEDGDSAGQEWGSLEFAKTYGFGIADWPGRDEALDDTTIELDDEPTAESPNIAYVEQLSESEQEAYADALYGTDTGAELPGGDLEVLAPTVEEEEEEDFEPGANPPAAHVGCYQQAQAALDLDADPYAEIYEDPAFQDLWDALDEYSENDIDPEVQATLDAEWQECMAGKGLTSEAAGGREELASPLYDEYDQLAQGENEDDYIDLTGDAAAEFTQREIELAVPDAECAQSVRYDERLANAYNELEQAFVDQHKAQLDALVAGVQKSAQ
ncbi:hypothetical protein [Leucobacter luti]|uniref:Uncharacterized protein n=1 Tax=Leucobacter luti TaxID=340320 RepID=A0A4V6MC09_9MICO|nr:hypothetical protein [Leucobacter luti]MBL3699749.1 hypothetical protein [Leucobacter luti]RZT62929.1 hypothetical protein EV139_2638 [Leucobacter luti]